MKLSAFYILFDNKELKIEPGQIYDGNNPLLIEYFNASSKGVKWTTENSETILYEPFQRLIGWPTPSLDSVVVIYPTDHPQYNAPNNAVVYQADGSIKFQLQMPSLISEVARKQVGSMKSGGIFDEYFEKVDWDTDSNGQTQIAITIAFNQDWWEKRILDTKKGTFGECISSGMR